MRAAEGFGVNRFSGRGGVWESCQMLDGEERAEERIWRGLPAGTREALTRDLAPTDLQTLLIAVARARAERVTPADVMRRWRDDRFVRPAASDPRRVAAVEARLWQMLPAELAGIELSPVLRTSARGRPPTSGCSPWSPAPATAGPAKPKPAC
jgi:hypothetical protein